MVEANRIIYLESELHMLIMYVLENDEICNYTMYEKLDVMESTCPRLLSAGYIRVIWLT